MGYTNKCVSHSSPLTRGIVALKLKDRSELINNNNNIILLLLL